jgi:hypothetical protein
MQLLNNITGNVVQMAIGWMNSGEGDFSEGASDKSSASDTLSTMLYLWNTIDKTHRSLGQIRHFLDTRIDPIVGIYMLLLAIFVLMLVFLWKSIKTMCFYFCMIVFQVIITLITVTIYELYLRGS